MTSAAAACLAAWTRLLLPCNTSLPSRVTKLAALLISTGVSSSPDSHAVFRLQIELVSGANVFEGFVPCLHIAHRVAAILSRGMGVAGDLLSQCSFALEPSPSLREC